jgi:putative transposase
MMADHVHMLIQIPPKYAASSVIGCIKGKRAIAVARQFPGKKRNFTGEQPWARGYSISTVGYEVDKIRAYIKNQENLESKLEEEGCKIRFYFP